MKINIKALELIEFGFTSKTVSKLTESQINVLHSKLLSEAITQTTSTSTSYNIPTSDVEKGVTLPPIAANKKVTIQKTPTGIKATPTEEFTEDETDDVTDKDSLGDEELQNLTGQEAPHDANDMAPDGMDDDSDNDREMMGMAEETKKNPWAICHAQLGPRKNAKFESCVKQVKKSLKEGKNPLTLFVENKIMEIVETHLPPKLTKKDLIKYLSEAEPATAPVKEPKTKPGTKTPPVKKPSHPGKNPNPNVNPAPKAKKIDPEQAKEKIIDTIIKMLEK